LFLVCQSCSWNKKNKIWTMNWKYLTTENISTSTTIYRYTVFPWVLFITVVCLFENDFSYTPLAMFLTWMGSFACHWHRHQVQGTSVLRLIRRTRAIEVKQLAQGFKQTWQWRESNPQPSDHESNLNHETTRSWMLSKTKGCEQMKQPHDWHVFSKSQLHSIRHNVQQH
jgi:hypothetical protein